jgi:hypothetical protein
MKCLRSLLAGVLLAGLVFVPHLDAQPFGLTNRVGNTSLRMPSSLPVFGYVTTNAFGALTFADPVSVKAPPGETNRLFVVEQNGIISVITNLAAPTRTLFLNIASRVAGGEPNDERGLLGLAFHPGYATNRYFFIYYSSTTISGTQLYQRLARMQTMASNPNAADPRNNRS